MKKRVIALFLCLTLSVCVCLPASAAFEECADALHGLGLFRGTNEGYALEQPATRAQALVMLIRLMGLEAEALEAGWASPYEDAAGWMSPYVGYACRMGLTNGVSDTEFAPNEPCTAQMYVTFLLRALGYDDITAGDFTYAGALDFAAGLGVVNDYALSGEAFLRSNMVALSYTALGIKPKDSGSDNLLQQLCDRGAVSRDRAQELLTVLAAYGSWQDACRALEEQTAVQWSSRIRTAAASGTLTLAELEQTLLRQRIGQGPETVYCLLLEESSTYGEQTEEHSLARLYRDGLCVSRSGDRIETAPWSETGDPIGVDPEQIPLCALVELTPRTTAEGKTLYNWQLTGDYLLYAAEDLGLPLEEERGLTLENYAVSCVLDGAGVPAAVYLDVVAETVYAGLPCTISLSSATELTAQGEAVQLAWDPEI